jgi:hypothetical protein
MGGLGYKNPTLVLLISYPQYNASPNRNPTCTLIFDTYATGYVGREVQTRYISHVWCSMHTLLGMT